MRSLRKLLLLVLLLVPISAFALFNECKDLFPGQQIPTSSQLGRDLCFDGFAIYYSPQDKKPIYTVEKLSQERLSGQHPAEVTSFMKRRDCLLPNVPNSQTTRGAAMTGAIMPQLAI